MKDNDLSLKERGIYNSCLNKKLISNITDEFTIELDDTIIYDQKNSCACWVYAFFNFFKPIVLKKLNVKDEEINFSVAYILYYSLLEKTNSLYKYILDNPKYKNSVISESLLDNYLNPYGYYGNALEIIEKYGIVLEDNMPMNYNTFNPFEFLKIFKEKVKCDIIKLLYESEKNMIEDLNRENEIIFAKVFGEPPKIVNASFKTKEDKIIKIKNKTPIDFYNYIKPNDLSDYVFIMSDNKKQYNKKYLFEGFTQIYNNKRYYYNISIEDIKKAIIEQLKEGIPVWFGCDFTPVCNSTQNKDGILDSNLFNFEKVLNIKILPKDLRDKFDCCYYHHAMVICGIKIENNKIINWKVRNSFGKENNRNGYFIMTNDYFDNYVGMWVINKKFINTDK